MVQLHATAVLPSAKERPSPIQVVARSKACAYFRSLAGIAGSNPVVVIPVSLLRVLCVVRYRSLRRADHCSREVIPSVVCCQV